MAEVGVRRGGSTLVNVLMGVIQLWFVIMALILATAFVLALLGGNPDASFASWIYARTDSIMRPFEGIFDPIQLTDETQIHTSLLFAIAVYVAIAGVLGAIGQRLRSL